MKFSDLIKLSEDVKKRLTLFSEERLTPREEKPCGFVHHFCRRQKWWTLQGKLK